MMNYKSGWLTLNRTCNLRCKWCYAQCTEYLKEDDLALSSACRLIDIFSDLNIRHIVLIGGEPTIYPHLFDVIDYCHKKNITCGIVTNGIKCAEAGFVKELAAHGIRSVSLSLKGENEKAFKNVTGIDAFGKVLHAVRLCLSEGIKVNVSMVLTEENIDSYLEGITRMKALGVERFRLSFCYHFNMQQVDSEQYLREHNPKQLIGKFCKNYDKLDEITDHHFLLSEGYPLCLWDDGIIMKMKKKRQITTVCQLLAKCGLLFDTKGNIIPCNAMPFIKLGRLDEDFTNAEELQRHMAEPKIIETYQKLCGVPDEKCLRCEKLVNCGGGCVCQWTNYDLKTLLRVTGVANG